MSFRRQLQIAASTTVKFTAGKAFKDAVNHRALSAFSTCADRRRAQLISRAVRIEPLHNIRALSSRNFSVDSIRGFLGTIWKFRVCWWRYRSQEWSGSGIHERYVDGIVDYCMMLQTFPARGVARDDLMPGLRVTHFRKRAIIAYLWESEVVSVVGVFYGDKDYEAALGADDE